MIAEVNQEIRTILWGNRVQVNPDDQWSDLSPPLTPEQMQRAADLTRLIMVDTFGEMYATAEMTCSRCLAAPTCALAFDCYNFDGDCLMEK